MNSPDAEAFAGMFAGVILTELQMGLDEENPVSTTESVLQGRSGSYVVHCEMIHRPRMLQVTIPLDVDIPESCRLDMAETVARANDGFRMGGFQLDMVRGTIRFVCGVPVLDGDVTPMQLASMILYAGRETDRYLPAFQQIASSSEDSPADVIASFEQKTHR